MDGSKLYYQSGDGNQYPYIVDIGIENTESNVSTEFYLRWIEIWLQSKCHNGWSLEAFEKPIYHNLTGIRIYFQNPHELVFFKLSPSYSKKVSISEFIIA